MDSHVFKVSQEREYNGFIAKGKLFLSGLVFFLSQKKWESRPGNAQGCKVPQKLGKDGKISGYVFEI
ncbi:hypothetical protein [Thiolapillus sp.]